LFRLDAVRRARYHLEEVQRAGGAMEPYAGVVAWKDGLIVRVTVYPDIAEARAAAERLAYAA
jgi:hypothetical protein